MRISNEVIAAGVGAGAGGLAGYYLAPSDKERLVYALCGAVALGVITYIVANAVKEKNVQVHCYFEPNAGKCVSEIKAVVQEVSPKSLKVLVACGTGNLVICIGTAVDALMST